MLEVRKGGSSPVSPSCSGLSEGNSSAAFSSNCSYYHTGRLLQAWEGEKSGDGKQEPT